MSASNNKVPNGCGLHEVIKYAKVQKKPEKVSHVCRNMASNGGLKLT
jgi:hypothetical protein